MTIEFDNAYLQQLEQQRQTASGQADRERQLDLLRPLAGERILDLGCGSGAHARAIASLVAPGGAVVGVDISPGAIELAPHLSAGVDNRLLSFRVADAHDLPFETGTFDGALCVSVLAFCRDPVLALRELRRVIRPGGRLVVAASDEDTRVWNGHDRELGRKVMRAAADRTLDPWAGRRLASWLRVAGFRIADEKNEVLVERRFTVGQSGYFMAHSLREYLVGPGDLPPEEYDRWLADLGACDEEGSYCYSRTQFTYLAEVEA